MRGSEIESPANPGACIGLRARDKSRAQSVEFALLPAAARQSRCASPDGVFPFS